MPHSMPGCDALVVLFGTAVPLDNVVLSSSFSVTETIVIDFEVMFCEWRMIGGCRGIERKPDRNFTGHWTV